MLFRKNWNIYLDPHEIDTDLTFTENVNYLINKYITWKEIEHDYD